MPHKDSVRFEFNELVGFLYPSPFLLHSPPSLQL